MDPVSAILGGIKLWTTVKPVKLIRNRRRAKRGLPPLEESEVMQGEKSIVTMANGDVIEKTEPLIKAKTSSKLAVGNGVIAAFPVVELLQWVQSIDIPVAWLETATNSDYFIYYGSLIVSYVIARFTKSPSAPQLF